VKGRGEYADDWPETAERVKREASWRCVRCLHPDDPETAERLGARRGKIPCDDLCRHDDARLFTPPTKQRILTVHHLDGDKSNDRWWNLAALCQVCHFQIQGKVRMEQTYQHPHSEWFLPYVAGYYMEEVEGLEVSRGFVEQNLVKCLAVGQPHLEDHYRERLQGAA
jgi:5-methylcytosine-specific restriction endonuclease McrA